jgi:chemotaxis protein histidine kinase CheA
VRDLSAELHKQVFVELENGEVELDREMIELIRDPLLHIIRNAIDHGIEPPADRLAAGKHEAGMLTVSARQSGNTIMIGIMDDGRGIDCDALVTKAVEAGVVEPAKAADLSRAAKIELIFEPGLSTAHRVTAISGRGVGMDVVRSNIEKFGGTLEIDTSLGTGTRFLISVPLTLSILPSLTVAAGGQTFAIPRSYVEEIVSTAAGNIELENGEVELDREMIELIRDPLLHIIRNAIDHGIEPPAERLAAGKHEAGMLTVSARQSGNTIMIGIMDDGRGIDCDALVGKAIEAGIVSGDKAAELTRAAKIELIFEPGLSTAHRVTAISGRGVGMDVVRSNIEKFGGTLEIDTSLGTGTRFLISVPLTLSILPSLTVSAGGQTFAIPRSYVEEIVSTAGGNLELAQVGERRLLTFREQRLPCVSLAKAMDIETSSEAKLFVILRLGWGDLYALEVERIFDHQELVIKPLSPEVMACGLFVGCTQLDDGLPVLVLDVATLGYANGIPRELHRPAAQQGPAAADEEGLPVVLLIGLDGARRAIAMSAVEQVERAPAAAVRRKGKHAQVVLGDEIVPLAGLSDGAELPELLPVLRLCAAAGGIAYAAREVLGIERLTEMPRKVGDDPTPLALFEGDPVELIDHMAFAERKAA